nr:thiamine phosphate synthase [uncultured Gellertiella sp.]
MSSPEERCRLVLIVPELTDAEASRELIGAALKGGDVASVILPQYGLSDVDFQKQASLLVPVIQDAGAAALLSGDSRVIGRVKADGIHISGNLDEFTEAMEKNSPRLIVGGGNANERHKALEIGELRPDYIFFGKLDGDIKPEAHPKNLALGEWWASMIEIPCVVMGGTSLDSALAIAGTGAEFAALRAAIFSAPQGAAAAIAEVNALLDEKAPRFVD